jgi:hypothetical protein
MGRPVERDASATESETIETTTKVKNFAANEPQLGI